MIKILIEKLKTLGIYGFISSFFEFYWKETTIRISENMVIELGGFILVLLIFILFLNLLNHTGIVNIF